MLKYILITIMAAFTLPAVAQNTTVQTDTFRVEGVCSMCKDRIENAAYIKGVKKVEWNKETKMLTVVYNPSKVTVQKIGQSIAKAGHDNDYAKASTAEYNKVHDCCRYREIDSH